MAELADRLKAIIAYKHDEVTQLKRERSLASLEADAKSASRPRGFAEALMRIAADNGNALICEVKRKSPSAGDISPGRDRSGAGAGEASGD